jgi:malonyl-CoA/methylmalonyl-CoA synthetase
MCSQWAAWRAGAIAVPLCTSHPDSELEYVLNDSGASIVISDTVFIETGARVAKRCSVPFVQV